MKRPPKTPQKTFAEPAGFQTAGAVWAFNDAKAKVRDMLRIVENFNNPGHKLHTSYPGSKWYAEARIQLTESLDFIVQNERQALDWIRRYGWEESTNSRSHNEPPASIARCIYRVGIRLGKVASLLEPSLRKHARSTKSGPDNLGKPKAGSAWSYIKRVPDWETMLTKERAPSLTRKVIAEAHKDGNPINAATIGRTIRRLRQRIPDTKL